MTGRVILALAIVMLAGTFVGAADWRIGPELALLAVAWLIALALSLPRPRPIDRARNLEADFAVAELREWRRRLLDDTFDPYELPTGELANALEYGASQLDRARLERERRR